MVDATRTARIRQLNDALRTGQSMDGIIVVTSGVQSHGADFLERTMASVRSFTDFSPDIDPYGEHDFGAVDVDGERLFFKVDYFDVAMTAHSSDPADPTVTKRVLTIMLASEY